MLPCPPSATSVKRRARLTFAPFGLDREPPPDPNIFFSLASIVVAPVAVANRHAGERSWGIDARGLKRLAGFRTSLLPLSTTHPTCRDIQWTEILEIKMGDISPKAITQLPFMAKAQVPSIYIALGIRDGQVTSDGIRLVGLLPMAARDVRRVLTGSNSTLEVSHSSGTIVLIRVGRSPEVRATNRVEAELILKGGHLHQWRRWLAGQLSNSDSSSSNTNLASPCWYSR